MRKIKTIIATALMTLVTFGAITYTACNKDHCKGVTCQNGGSCNSSNGSCSCPSGYTGTYCEVKGTSAVHFVNKTFTPISLSLNGHTYVIDTGWHATFTGSYGDSLVGSAFTQGQFGTRFNWDTVRYVFPKTGDVNVDLNVSSDYFFLTVTNNDNTSTIRKIYANYGKPQETLDIAVLPPNGWKYFIGYYAYTDSSVVRVDATPLHWDFNDVGTSLYPPQLNQVYNAIVP